MKYLRLTLAHSGRLTKDEGTKDRILCNLLLSTPALSLRMDRVNVDTDQIVPKQFIKWLTREGYGRVLFLDWRYLDDGETPNPEFVLNAPRYQGASVLVARANFGCGSSREHAPWAILDYGFRAILAPELCRHFL